MGKIKNITPEEREKALALIRKCGFEETENNINYYVRMQRDSKRHREEKEIPSEKSPIENKADGVQVLTPNEGKKVVRIAKAGRWIIFFAIILTFVKAGFGFSFWWYIYLFLLALVAIGFWGVTIPDSGCIEKTYDSNDVSITKTFSWIGIIMLVILYLWGPLNPNFVKRGGESGSYRNDQVSKTSWTCVVCNKSFEYYEDEIGEHNKWKYWSGDKICYDCYKLRKSVNDALKKNNSPYANYNQ